MPTYDYACRRCGHTFEAFQSINDKLLKKCPACGKQGLDRLFGTGIGVVFKGSGFYETDYKRAGTKEATSSSSDGGKSAGSSSGASKDGADTSPSKDGSGKSGDAAGGGSTAGAAGPRAGGATGKSADGKAGDSTGAGGKGGRRGGSSSSKR